jgi:anion-transporting  ArsA/GET3 family ATPase
MTSLLDRQLVFVTGKGGVGKTTVAAALALLASRHGKRTLVCETDAKGGLAGAYGVTPTTFEPREVQPDLFAITVDTEDSLKEYMRLQMKLPLLAKLGPLARTFDFIANAAPGVKEVLIVGKPVYEVREGNYDLVIVDAAATGHVVAQLAAPEAIAELVKVGLVASQTGWMMEILHDPARTGVAIVCSPEEMPVAETIELAGRINEETKVDLAAVIANRVLPELFGRGEEEVFERMREPQRVQALSQAVGGPAGPVLDAAELAVTLRRTRAGHLDHLRSSLPPKVPLVLVPELFARNQGIRATTQVAEALGAELDFGHEDPTGAPS